MAKQFLSGLSLVLLMVLATSVEAQSIKTERLRGLGSTTTYVQLLGYTDYDVAIRTAMKDWTLTADVVFVEKGEDMGDVTDPSNTFLSFWDKLYGPIVHRELAFWQGGPAWRGVGVNDGSAGATAFNESFIATWPLDLYGKEIAYERMGWRMPLVIGSLTQMVDFARGSNTKRLEATTIVRGLAPRMSGKTLLVRKDRFFEKDRAAMIKKYHGKMEFVDIAVIQEAIDERDDRYAVLCVVESVFSSMLVYDLGTRTMVYAKSLGKAKFKPSALAALGSAVNAD